MDLRCEGSLLGVMIDETHIELPCKRRRCGKRPGVVVLHTLDITTGEVTRTRKFADPARRDNSDGTV